MRTQRLIPCLIFEKAAVALDFYARAFGATELMRLVEHGSGRIGHAEMSILGEKFYLAEAYPELGILPSKTILMLEVEDPDAWVEKAVQAGAIANGPVKDEFHGDRTGTVTDPFGNRWSAFKRVEEVSPAEMQRRYDALIQSGNSEA